jgi:hypothetical protein
MKKSKCLKCTKIPKVPKVVKTEFRREEKGEKRVRDWRLDVGGKNVFASSEAILKPQT